MTIKVKKDPTMSGVYRASYGKRKIIIVLPILNIKLGLLPTLNDIIQGFNDNSKPGDSILTNETKVSFL